MRQEDKEVDGPDLGHAEDRKRENELIEEKDDALYDLDGRPETTVDKKQSGEVIGAMRAILKGDHLIINDLKLDKRHLVALEALKTAVEGKDQQLSKFVFAEDRRTLLEQALAVLQPELASIQGLGDEFQQMIAQVSTLREKLNVLEDAEEELVEGRAKDSIVDESDSDDKPDESDDVDDPNKNKPAKPSKKKRAPGEQSVEDAALIGPERAEPPKQPTTLGDPKEIAEAAAATTPRWRRPNG